MADQTRAARLPRPVVGRCAAMGFLVKPVCRAIVREVQPARREYRRSVRRKLMSASPVIDPAPPVSGPSPDIRIDNRTRTKVSRSIQCQLNLPTWTWPRTNMPRACKRSPDRRRFSISSASGSARMDMPPRPYQETQCSAAIGADVALTGAYQGRRRMTLTYPTIHRARRILWVVTGSRRHKRFSDCWTVMSRFRPAECAANRRCCRLTALLLGG